MSKKKLFLIDGHALIFRMYFAFLRQPMINSKGEDTSILFGVTKYVLEIIKREKPTHVVVAFDPPCKTFRHEMYPEYKGTRSATPELVKSSLEPLVEIIESMGIPVVMVNGYEADDVIGTLAVKGEENGFQVYMVTPDKDLGQLISDNIFQFKANNTRGHNELLGKAEICEKYGIKRPSQIIEILTIWGDSSDNIKGVKGIGEVGAKKLIAEYDNIENILDHMDELSESHQKAFRLAEPHLGLMKELITIKTDIDLSITEADFKFAFSDFTRTKELFRKYEFHSLTSLLPERKGKIAPIFEDIFQEINIAEYTVVEYPEISNLASNGHSVGIKMEKGALYLSSGNKVFITTNYHLAKDILENPEITKIGYDIKGSLNKLRDHSISLNGYFAEIEILHYLLNPERIHKIEILTEKYLGIDIACIYQTTTKRGPAREADLFSSYEQEMREDDEGIRLIKESSVLTRLYDNILNDIKKQGNDSIMELYESIEMPLLRVLADMEYQGFKIDSNMLSTYSEKLSKEAAKIEARIRIEAGEPSLNISSFKQIGILIYEKLKLNPKIKKNGRNSYPTDENSLNEFKDKHPIVNDIIEYRSISKLISTYIDPFPNLINPETGKVHTTFNQAMTATGRLSSAKPNIQNIPIRTKLGQYIREAFIPSTPDGYIVSADYSQIELRVMAAMSEDPALISAFNKKKDIHTSTASRIFNIPTKEVTPEQRRIAKTANFGIMYGISAFGLSKKLTISPHEAKEIITEYFKSYPGLYKFMEKTKATAREIGYVETICKRKRYFPNISSDSPVTRALSERNAINAPIQGSAADIIKVAMINIAKRFIKEGIKSKMILQVHDELVFDVIHEEKDIVMKIAKEEMESVFSLSVPLTVDCSFGSNWLKAH